MQLFVRIRSAALMFATIVVGLGCDHGNTDSSNIGTSNNEHGDSSNGDSDAGDSSSSSSSSSSGGDIHEGSDGGGGGEMTYRRITLPLPDGLSEAHIFDMAAVGEAAWVSAYTFDGSTHGNGPIVLWEKGVRDEFVLATFPPTNHTFFPDVCAVSAEEVYVLAVDGPEQTARLFTRKPGTAPIFEEQPAPEAAAGTHFRVMRLACFPGGNLWAYGSMQKGDDINDKAHAFFHRPSARETWQAVPLPDDLPSKIWSSGVSLALLRADGSGYVGFSIGGESRIYERTPGGAWAKVHAVGDEAFQITSAVGDPSGRAVAVAQPRGDQGIVLVLEDGAWSTKLVPEASELWATAQMPTGRLLLGGVRYLRDGDAVTGAEPVLLDDRLQRLPVPVRGRIQAMAFLSNLGYLGIDFTEKPEDTGLYEVTF